MLSPSLLSRRRLLQGLSALAASSMLSGCGASLYQSVAASGSPSASNPQPRPFGPFTAASLSIASTSVGAFAGDFIGLAYEKDTLPMPLFRAANTDLIGLFGRLGVSVLRIGGDSVDTHVWTPEGPGQTPGQIAPADVDALAAFLRATGWRCVYGINLGGSATGATTPALAAAEVAYVARALGSALVGIEIGNECENYRDSGSFYPGNFSVERFQTLWSLYREAIVAQTPNAPLIGPAAGSDVAGWTIPWSESITARQIGLITQHYYRGSAAASTVSVADLLSPDPALAAELALLREGAQSVGVPFRLAECNSYWDGGAPGVSDAYASSLWAIDMVFQCALGGAAGVNFQGGNKKIYTPIADNEGPVLGAMPVFYGLLLASMAGSGSLLATDLDASSLNVTAYAIQNPGGGTSLILVNKDATQNLDLSITLPQTATSATLQGMTQQDGLSAPQLAATTGVTIQGSGVAADGAFTPADPYTLTLNGRRLSCYVPALSAVLLHID